MRVAILAVLGAAGCDLVFLGERPPDASLPDATIEQLTFGTPVPLATANTIAEEDHPSLTDDLLELYFQREQQLFVALRVSPAAEFSTPRLIPELVTPAVRPCISGDGLRLSYSHRAADRTTLDVYTASRPLRDEPWGAPVRLTAFDQMDSTEYCGWERADRRVMLLESAAIGTPDIWQGRRETVDGPLTLSLASGLNSDARDGAPWANGDGSIIVFDSTRAPTEGGDLFQAVPAGLAFAIRPLTELNTSADDRAPWLSADGRTIVFASTRDDPAGDLYMATR